MCVLGCIPRGCPRTTDLDGLGLFSFRHPRALRALVLRPVWYFQSAFSFADIFLSSMAHGPVTLVSLIKYTCHLRVQNSTVCCLNSAYGVCPLGREKIEGIGTLPGTEHGVVPESLCDSLTSPLPFPAEMQRLWGLWSHLEEQQVPHQLRLWPSRATASENQEGERKPGSSQALGFPNTRNHKPG